MPTYRYLGYCNIYRSSDYDPPPNATYLTNLNCAANSNYTAHCRDTQKGEAIKGFKNDSVGMYIIVCTAPEGLICTPWQNSSCPDHELQFGCNQCLTTTQHSSGTAGTYSPVKTYFKFYTILYLNIIARILL